MPTAPEWIIDITDPKQSGLLRQFGSPVRENPPRFVRNDGVGRRVRLITRRRTEDGFEEWDDVDKEGLALEVAIGNPDQGATAGSFAGAYEGDSTGLGGLAFDISEAALLAALNANVSLAAEGGVTVRKNGVSFSVTWNNPGARGLLLFDAANLLPRCNIATNRVVPGDALTREVQVVTIVQTPYAYNATWGTYPVGNVSVTRVQLGTVNKKEIQRLSLSEPAYKGSLFINFPRPEIVKFTARSNAAEKEAVRIYPRKDETTGSNSLNELWVDLYGTNNATRRFWFNTGAGVAPPVPDGGTNHQVTIAPDASQKDVATALQAVIHAHADFNAELKAEGSGAFRTWRVVVTSTAFGARTQMEDVSGTGFTFSRKTVGNYGRLNGKTFTLSDKDGTVGVYFNVSGSLADVPDAAAECTRVIEITAVNPNDGANTVAAAIQAAVDGDAEFSASRAGNVVTVTDDAGGARPDASAGDTGFGLTKVQDGADITATVAYSASAKDMADALGGEFKVLKSADYTWEFTFPQPGPQPLIEVDAAALFPTGFEGVLDLNTYEMFLAFQAAETDEIDAFLEASMTYEGKKPLTILRLPVKVVKDVINPATMVPLEFGAIPRHNLPALLVQKQRVDAGAEFTIPDGYDLIIGSGFAVDGSLTINGSGRLIVV